MINLNRMDELIKKLQEKAKFCGDSTKEDRARKGAYIDCIVELKALRKHAVSNRYTLEDMIDAYDAGVWNPNGETAKEYMKREYNVC
jgi:hypothetical protein